MNVTELKGKLSYFFAPAVEQFTRFTKRLAKREKILLGLGGTAFIIMLIYFFLWEPIEGETSTLQLRIQTNRTLLTWMKNADQEFQELQQRVSQPEKIVTPDQLLSAVDQSVKQSSLRNSVTQLAATDQNEVEVQFNSVYFDNLIKWLTQLWLENRIEVDQAIITSKSVGMVQADITLKSSGATS